MPRPPRDAKQARCACACGAALASPAGAIFRITVKSKKGPCNSDWIGGYIQYPSVTQLNKIHQYIRKYSVWCEPSVLPDERWNSSDILIYIDLLRVKSEKSNLGSGIIKGRSDGGPAADLAATYSLANIL